MLGEGGVSSGYAVIDALCESTIQIRNE